MKKSEENYNYEICPPGLSVQAMRFSGYKDTAHAIAELIDNSIQAGILVKKPKTNVEVICNVSEDFGQRTIKKIKEIAVYDNTSGMSPETLRIALQFGNGTHLKDERGIGKFGMGLPNSSISQCRHVDVYSWQKNGCYHTYLDIDEIFKGKMRLVPEPVKAEIPKNWIKMISKRPEENGTLVIWSKLDQLRWKTPVALFENSEFLIGRIYRYFLNDNKVSIRLAAFLENGSNYTILVDKYVLPNDPLYLMTGTCSPKPFDKKAAFVLFNESVMKVKVNGKEENIKLRFSICTEEPRKLGGSNDIGKHAAKNVGVSLVRANRELEMNMSFVNRYDPRERWWGCEVIFEPHLDPVFGVTNTKQAATSFYRMDLEEDAKTEGMTPKAFTDHLNEMEDSRVIIYHLSKKIDEQLSIIRAHIEKMREGIRSGKEGVPEEGSAEAIGTEAVKRRKEIAGLEGASDKKENEPEAQKKDELATLLSEITEKPVEEVQELAGQILNTKVKFVFEKAALPGHAFFDIRSTSGLLVIVINTNHPASKHLFQLLEKDPEDESKLEVLMALKLMLFAWARLEDEAPFATKQKLEDTRHDWGRAARDFIQVSEEWK